jgi:glycosyltransferase involved in cell wall biosynthesis
VAVVQQPRLAYVVSRFPELTQTFVLRELDAVAAAHDISLYALFATAPDVVHERARPWLSTVRRASPGAGLAAVAYWAARSPLSLLRVVGFVLASHARRPSVLVRALVSVPVALAHARTMKREGIRHVHAHFGTYPALAAWIAHRLMGTSYSFTVHAHDLFVHQLGLARKVDDAAFVVAISDYNRRRLEQLSGSDADVRVVHCGIELDRFTLRPRRLPAEGPVQAACVASFEEYKGQEILVRAMAHAGMERVRARFAGDGPRRAPVEKLVVELGLEARVEFAGALREEEVRALLADADLFVLPSIIAANGDMEGIPVALMEAMAIGLPVVTTELSGIPELVRDGETGWLARPADPDSLARTVAAALSDPDEAARRALAGRELVEREFDLQASAAELIEAFSGVLSPRRRARS